jgi:hypothetical protein
MSYIGNEPIVSATRTVTEVTATAGQTVFTANGGYTVGYLDVFLNGSKLTSADFTATNGTTVTLTEAAQVSDIVRLEALGTFLASNGVAKTGDTMTGDLDVLANIGVGTLTPNKGGVGRAVTLNTSSGGNIIEMCVAEDRKGWLYADDSRTALAAGGNRLAEIQTNGTARVVVDGSGRVTTPSQPAFRASIATSFVLTPTVQRLSGSGFLTERFDIGNNFDPNTSRFTAPVAGIYIFGMYWAPPSTGRMNSFFYVNNSQTAVLSSANGGASFTTILSLSAGDYVEPWVQSSTGSNITLDNSGELFGYLLG